MKGWKKETKLKGEGEEQGKDGDVGIVKVKEDKEKTDGRQKKQRKCLIKGKYSNWGKDWE